MGTKVDIRPSRKDYDDCSKTVDNLNKQIRNYNIKTNIKIALVVTLFFASSMLIALATFSSFGLSLPITAITWSVVSASSISAGIIILFFSIVRRATIKRLSNNQNKFLDKINKIIDAKKYVNFKLLKNSYYIDKIRLDSYDKYHENEQKNFEIQKQTKSLLNRVDKQEALLNRVYMMLIIMPPIIGSIVGLATGVAIFC